MTMRNKLKLWAVIGALTWFVVGGIGWGIYAIATKL